MDITIENYVDQPEPDLTNAEACKLSGGPSPYLGGAELTRVWLDGEVYLFDINDVYQIDHDKFMSDVAYRIIETSEQTARAEAIGDKDLLKKIFNKWVYQEDWSYHHQKWEEPSEMSRSK